MAEEITPDPQNAGTQERPEWLPERYDSPEQLAKAYAEAERKITELSERAKHADALEENYTQLAARLEQVEAQRTQAQSNDAAAPLIQAYQDAYERGDAAAMLGIQAQVAQMAAQGAVAQVTPQFEQRYQTLEESQANEIGVYAARTLEQRYGDQFEEARGTMQDIIQANPYLIPDAAKYDPTVAVAALENVYRIATHGTAQAQTPVATDQAKQLAQTATGAGTRVLTADEAKQEWEQIKGAAARSYWEPRQ